MPNDSSVPSGANAHVIVFHETGLRRVLKDYFAYCERCRTHVSLEKDAPVSRPVEPPSLGPVIEIPKVGGLHHLYTRKGSLIQKNFPTVAKNNTERTGCSLICEVQFFVA